MPKQAEAKRDGVIIPQNNNFNQFYTENLMLSKRYESTEVYRRIWLHVPSGSDTSRHSDCISIQCISMGRFSVDSLFPPMFGLAYKNIIYLTYSDFPDLPFIYSSVHFWFYPSCLELICVIFYCGSIRSAALDLRSQIYSSWWHQRHTCSVWFYWINAWDCFHAAWIALSTHHWFASYTSNSAKCKLHIDLIFLPR